MQPRPHNFPPARRSVGPAAGFTLVELMVSVALVLVLILGINEVFRLTSDTVGAGQAVSNALRDQRAARQLFEDDFKSAAADGPYFIIRNEAVAAFRSAEDLATNRGLKANGGTDVSLDPSYIDNNGDGVADKPGEVLSPAVLNSRMHRVDSITFFSRKPAKRQTGNLGNNGRYTDLVSDLTSSEAVVTIGHLRQPDNATLSAASPADYAFFDPAQGAQTVNGTVRQNDNNRFATQWLLGRNQMLLVPKITAATTVNTNYCGTTGFAPVTVTNQADLAPLSMRTWVIGGPGTDATQSPSFINAPNNPGNSGASNVNSRGLIGGGTTNPRIWESKLDLAVTNIALFANRLANYRAQATSVSGSTTISRVEDVNGGTTVWPWFLPPVPSHYLNVTPGVADNNLPGATLTNVPETLLFRYNGFPFATRPAETDTNPTAPDLGAVLAQTHPILLPRVSQFIVEYAGDYLQQDPDTGAILDTVSDGQVDFLIFAGQKRIRWYGLPRYTDSGFIATTGSYVGPVVAGKPPINIGIPAQASASGLSGQTTISIDNTGSNAKYPGVPTPRNTNALPDVVPLSDVLMALTPGVTSRTGGGPKIRAEHERVIMPRLSDVASNSTSTALDTVDSAKWMPPVENYANPDPTIEGRALRATNSIQPSAPANLFAAQYICAWAGGGPKMIRITMTLEDPNPRNLTGGRTYEYVFNLPY